MAQERYQPPASFTTPLAATLAEDLLERFLRYVRIDTQADEAAKTYPSSPGQLELGRLLVKELKDLGLQDAVYALSTGLIC